VTVLNKPIIHAIDHVTGHADPLPLVNPDTIFVPPDLMPYIYVKPGSVTFAHQAGGISSSGVHSLPSQEVANGGGGEVNLHSVKANWDAGFTLAVYMDNTHLVSYGVMAIVVKRAVGGADTDGGQHFGTFAEIGAGASVDAGWMIVDFTGQTQIIGGSVAYEDEYQLWIAGNADSPSAPIDVGAGTLYWKWVSRALLDTGGGLSGGELPAGNPGQVLIASTGGQWSAVDGYKDAQIADDAAIQEHKLAMTKTAVSSNHTATATEDYLEVDATSGAITVALPDATTNPGRLYLIVKSDSSSNPVTIDPSGSQTIDAFATAELRLQRDGLYIVSDGANWRVISRKRKGYSSDDTTAQGLVATRVTRVSKTANYSASYFDELIEVDATGGAVTITLPLLADSGGQLLIVKKVDASANAVTVDGFAAETVDGAANTVLSSQWDGVMLVNTASGWRIVGGGTGGGGGVEISASEGTPIGPFSLLDFNGADGINVAVAADGAEGDVTIGLDDDGIPVAKLDTSGATAGDVPTFTGSTVSWQPAGGGSSGTVRCQFVAQWVSDTLPAAAGPQTPVFRVPRINGEAKTFQIQRLTIHLETYGATTTSVKIQKAAGGTGFSSPTDVGSISLSAADYDETTTTSLGVIASDDVLRPNFTALGSGAALYTIELEAVEI